MHIKSWLVAAVTAALLGGVAGGSVLADTQPVGDTGRQKILGLPKARKKSVREAGRKGPAAASGAKAPGKLFTVRMATQTGFNEVPIGVELGFFREEGIEIRYVGVLKPGTELISVLSGDNDMFTGHPPSLAKAILGGAKLKAVAPGMVDHPDFPHVQYLVKEGSPIKSLKDVIGKKVAVSSRSECSDGYITWWLKRHNLPTNVEWVVMPAEQMEQALRQGLIDMTTSHPPHAGQTMRRGGVTRIGTSYDIVQSPAGGLSIRGFSDTFIREHPEVVKGFVRALYRSRVWINANQEEAARMTARRLKMKPEDVSVFYYDEHPTIEDPYIRTWFRLAVENGLWKEGAIKTTDIYTNAYYAGK
jgi:ABC-type nitrate/sulfonate/bicarbonate transport system substrate-binding protein